MERAILMTQINECPLCGQVLKLKQISSVATYRCPADPSPHYEVERDIKQTITHFYAFPYAVDNYENSSRSRVHQWIDNRWRFIKEVSRITPRPSQELLDHLQKVMPE